ncbi:hypothetical protein FH972_017761 [Carpinus fangiana]|uniref:Uncharacterized protein n=1 Tax=Carpinus fangiana TaxID=176857 RepID=A0A5N6RKE3_9ROSI|nr:hypothetical protein FH972_017761 [Carpinus fangiana]
MEVKDALGVALLGVLYGSDNYADWSIRVQTYLMAKDLWDTIEATAQPPKQEDDEATFKAWSNKNSMALHVIKNSCSPNTLFEIWEISFAKVAWNTLAEKYLPKGTSSGRDVAPPIPHAGYNYSLKVIAAGIVTWFGGKENGIEGSLNSNSTTLATIPSGYNSDASSS